MSEKRPPAEPWPVRKVERIELVRTTAIFGDGTEDRPWREVVQFWTPDGEFVAKWDPWSPSTFSFEHIIGEGL